MVKHASRDRRLLTAEERVARAFDPLDSGTGVYGGAAAVA